MALINCPDCGTEVSDAAAACPKCARPITPAATPMESDRPAQKRRGAGAGFTLVVLIALGVWIYYQANAPDQSPAADASQVSSTPAAGTSTGNAQAPQAAAAQARPVFVTTPADLYRAYSTNEVATNQALAGKTIQFTAPVLSIDEDFTDSAVLAFSTGDEFSKLQATLKDSDKAAAAQLSPGQVVTVRCATFQRILDSPMGEDCTFQVGGESSASSGPAEQSVATDQQAATAEAAAAASVAEPSVPTAATADDSTPDSGGSVSSTQATASNEVNTAGPSFDCSKVTDATDLTICSNAELSELDRQMAALYHVRMQSVDDPTVRDAQRAWLLDRNQCGADVICLQKQYAARIQQLQE
ncbi:MAG TPA: lysozyme inhibitor LprI family protein [Rhodanobacteraceae bacterium]|nr:lysozyme inhibitor LprI family protein [Rhodanobacteraceae bacterium]